MLRAARESTKGQVIAVVQPHRYTRLAALFEQFCTCFNDADTVIVAPVYPAGEAPIAGVDRDALVQACAPTATARSSRSKARRNSPRWSPAWRSRATMLCCLGAGSITQWAYALPGELAAGGRDGVSRSLPIVANYPLKLRGKLLADQSLAELTWFRVGGPGAASVHARGRSRPTYFIALCRPMFPLR